MFIPQPLQISSILGSRFLHANPLQQNHFGFEGWVSPLIRNEGL